MAEPGSIEIVRAGFVLHLSDGSYEIPWPRVREVAAFKRDRFAVDDVCLSIQVGEKWFEVDEEMPGWAELLEGLERSLMGIVPWREWRPRVVHPPFARNEEIIFRRAEL